MIIIEKDGDLMLHVYEPPPKDGPERFEVFQVSRAILMKSSTYFHNQLSPNRFAESEKAVVTLKEDNILNDEILLRVLHDAPLDNVLKVPIKEMWPLVMAVDKYQVDIELFYKWFAQWYQAMESDLYEENEAAKLLFPCYTFQHARGFAKATRMLAYGTIGSIEEKNPTKYHMLHLRPRVIQQINAAKGRLRTILHMKLFASNARLLSATCKCKEATLFGYEKQLYDMNVWPLEQEAQRQSINAIIEKLKGFQYEPPSSACMCCRDDYDSHVAAASAYVASYFDGLCLNCMDRSKPKTGDSDNDYWQHLGLPESAIIKGCKFQHKQPTWYFSFMGRKEDRERAKKARQPKRPDSWWSNMGAFWESRHTMMDD